MFQFLSVHSCVLLGAVFFICTSPLNSASAAEVTWTEDFQSDPIAQGRFSIPSGHDGARFTYNAGAPSLTMHVDSDLATAWYVRPLDAVVPLTLAECDDYQFVVEFRIHSQGFSADPQEFGQIAWGLLNSSATGEDRAGATMSGPYAFDCVSVDYFPNVHPTFGGPTLATTTIQSDIGQGYFNALNSFPFGAESELKAALGDEIPALDVTYTAQVAYSSETQVAVLSLTQGTTPLNINNDGGGGPGGADQNPATIQTFAIPPFAVDSFALMAWEAPSFAGGTAVAADVEIFQISFHAIPLMLGDMNRDGRADGLDIGPFVQTLLASQPDACVIKRADFDQDTAVTTGDIAGFVAALVAP